MSERLTEDEIKKLILDASTEYERYTAQVIAKQRKQITGLEAEVERLRAALDAIAHDAQSGSAQEHAREVLGLPL